MPEGKHQPAYHRSRMHERQQTRNQRQQSSGIIATLSDEDHIEVPEGTIDIIKADRM